MSARTKNDVRPSGAAHGVLVVDKPGKMTSHDVVARVRRAFGTRRVGHAGTLDPMATGVLVVLLGEATKLSSVLTTDRKTYEARIRFGTSTDTLDAEGTILKRVQPPQGWLSDERLEQAISSEKNRRLQIPPEVSAIKVDGQRSYARARRGEAVALNPRDVVVHELELLRRDDEHVDLRVCVSKGYYVRALARDLGALLSVPAHLAALRRVASGPFGIDRAHSLPLTGKEPLSSIDDAARSSLPTLDVSADGASKLRDGKRLTLEDLLTSPPHSRAPLLAAFASGRLVALVEPSDSTEFRVKRGFNHPTQAGSALQPAEKPG